VSVGLSPKTVGPIEMYLGVITHVAPRKGTMYSMGPVCPGMGILGGGRDLAIEKHWYFAGEVCKNGYPFTLA